MAVTRRSSRPARLPKNQAPNQDSGRTLRARATRSAPIYDSPGTSDDTDPDEESDAATGSEHDIRNRRPRRKTRRPSASSVLRPSTRRTRIELQRHTVGRENNETVKSQKQYQKRSTDRSFTAILPSGKRRKLSIEERKSENTGNIPDWRDPRIPYDAWANIFFYAGAHGTDTSWLIHAATTCHAFLEPALAAIYRSPQPKTPAKAKRLVALLDRSPCETLINYRTKVESLYIDIHTTPQAILFQMIYPLICLKELVIFTTLDHPPYRNLDKSLRWHYPAEIFRALAREAVDPATDHEKLPPIILRSWEWSGRLLGGHVPTIGDIARIHQTTSFSQLTRVSFTNFQVPSLHKPQPKEGDETAALKLYEDDVAVVDSVAAAISQLEALQHLVFESSTVMNDRLLPLLPRNLVHLELINCWEIRSEDLAPFLQTHGSKMRILTLMHNQSLNLAFLTNLAGTCPNLYELRMSMSYFRHHDSIDDSDPMYDYALLPDQVPSWPSSTRVIDLEHVRDWSVETAEMFLQSLINSAKSLPNLRHLAIKTMLNIPWQVRATMRSEWKSKMEKVFLRQSETPSNTTAPQELDEASTVQKKSRRKRSLTPSRRSGRIAAHEAETTSQSTRASKSRSRSHGRSFYKEPDTDDEEFDDVDASEDEDEKDIPLAEEHGEEPELHIQGLCKTVNILFDNQKPREVQYGMEDFLTDNEEESEDDWDGDEEDDDDAVAF